MRVRCYYCGESLDADRTGVYQLVRGWERRRKSGGTNAIRLPERADRWACHACIEIRAAGFVEGQDSLW